MVGLGIKKHKLAFECIFKVEHQNEDHNAVFKKSPSTRISVSHYCVGTNIQHI